MARKQWPASDVYLPGMSPYPDGWSASPARRKPTKRRTERVIVVPPGRSPIERIATEIGPGLYSVQLKREDTIIGGGLEVRRPRAEASAGRPATYDHPLALAARAGRKHAMWRGPEPEFATAEERRAFEIGRARKLAWRRGER